MTVTEQVVVGQLVEVPVGDLVPDPTNRPISESSVDALVPSILELGVLEPIITAADGVSIVDGERRWRAATKAGLATVPVRPSDFADRRRWVMASTVANFAREEPHPLDAGVRLKELQELGFTQKEIADLLGHGWSQPQVSNRIVVVDGFALLPDDLRDVAERAYRDDVLLVRQAEDLARLAKLCADEAFAAGEVDGGGDSLVPVRQVLDVATEERKGELDRMIAPHLAAARRREQYRKVRATVVADGERDITDLDIAWVSLRDLTSEIDNPLDGHAELACHAVFVTPHAEITWVCTDPASHRNPVSAAADEVADDDGEGDLRSQDEIAQAEKAAAASRPVSPEQQAEAQARLERQERAAAVRDGWPARLEVARAALKRTRSAAKALDHLVLALAMDGGNVEWLYEPLADLLEMSDVDAGEFGAALVARAVTGGEMAVQIGAAMAWAAGEVAAREAAGQLDRGWGKGEVQEDVARALRAYTDRLAIEGHDLTAAELATAAIPAPDVEEPEAHDEETFEPDAVRVIAAAEWGMYEGARNAVIAMPKSTPKATAFDDAKKLVAAALVSEHPDPNALHSELEAVTATYRTAWEAAVEDGGGVIASTTLVELQARAADGVIAALVAGTDQALPEALVDAIRDRGELDAGERPTSTKAGEIRHLYVDDLLDACEDL